MTIWSRCWVERNDMPTRMLLPLRYAISIFTIITVVIVVSASSMALEEEIGGETTATALWLSLTTEVQKSPTFKGGGVLL